MTDSSKKMPIWVDFTPAHAAEPAMYESIADMHRQLLERNLKQMIDRQGRLSNMHVHAASPSAVLVAELLAEARMLYIMGYYYSCVAMCGIVAERIVKDLIRNSLAVKKDEYHTPSPKAFDQLERVDVRSLINFAAECGLLSGDAKKAACNLGDLRNTYAHARGKAPDSDALKAIEFLQTVVDNTVSIFHRFDLQDGTLVPKNSDSEAGPS